MNGEFFWIFRSDDADESGLLGRSGHQYLQFQKPRLRSSPPTNHGSDFLTDKPRIGVPDRHSSRPHHDLRIAACTLHRYFRQKSCSRFCRNAVDNAFLRGFSEVGQRKNSRPESVVNLCNPPKCPMPRRRSQKDDRCAEDDPASSSLQPIKRNPTGNTGRRLYHHLGRAINDLSGGLWCFSTSSSLRRQ